MKADANALPTSTVNTIRLALVNYRIMLQLQLDNNGPERKLRADIERADEAADNFEEMMT